MKRYLVIDSSCALCTNLAQKVCNETQDWIHDVLSMNDARAKEWLAAAGHEKLLGPAIVEVDGENTQVLAGRFFRWRVFKVLGPQRAFRLARVIAGDLAAGNAGISRNAEASALGQGAAVSQKTPKLMGRRGFLRIVTGAVAVFSVVTGLGFSKWSASSRKFKNAQAKADFLQHGWITRLKFDGEDRSLEGEELQAAWKDVAGSRNVKKLLSSKDFELYHKASDLRGALSTNATHHALADLLIVESQVPKEKWIEFGEKLRARGEDMDDEEAEKFFESHFPLDPTRKKVSTNTYTVGREQRVEGGRTLRTASLIVNDHMFMAVELKKGDRKIRSELMMYKISAEVRRTIAALRNGRFIYKRSGDFGGPGMRVASRVVGGGLAS